MPDLPMSPAAPGAATLPAPGWSPDSWRRLPARQLPDFEDAAHLSRVEARLRGYPPLVFAGEARALQAELAAVAEGRAFLLQGGDCAESFAEFHPDTIRDSLRVLLQMAVVLIFGAGTSVVKVGRLAGQFAKPRSSPVERQGEVELPSYRGDIVNALDFTLAARRPDPERQLQAYAQAAATLNLVRAFTEGGYAALSRVHDWYLGFVGETPQARLYQDAAARISEALGFMAACGVSGDSTPAVARTRVYTSHEALLLGFEEAMTRVDSTSGAWYNTAGHLVWVGDRTRDPAEAHVEYLRGIANPLGLKAGPSLDPDGFVRLCDALDPRREPGRLTVITRFGQDGVARHLPPLLRAARREGRRLVWACDPMHGNTVTSDSGLKTRRFERILGEVEGFFAAHAAEGTHPGGLHVEMTGQDVTECTGGSGDASDAGLPARYRTHCDPRLNAAQSLELAFLLADRLRRMRRTA
ncbi:class II 3-deoxy-7-phosphoheptulonate synthase [Dankookia rubra]|nr:3-deoxy-7-phosphoheptulonate synthase class II [Dankookia rubra]